MKNRSIVGVVVLTVITFGIYAIVWAIMTKDEMNEAGAEIPTAWWILVPFANIWWKWKYCEGLEHVTRGRVTAPVAFLYALLFNVIAIAVFQHLLNEAEPAPSIPRAQVVT